MTKSKTNNKLLENNCIEQKERENNLKREIGRNYIFFFPILPKSRHKQQPISSVLKKGLVIIQNNCNFKKEKEHK